MVGGSYVRYAMDHMSCSHLVSASVTGQSMTIVLFNGSIQFAWSPLLLRPNIESKDARVLIIRPFLMVLAVSCSVNQRPFPLFHIPPLISHFRLTTSRLRYPVPQSSTRGEYSSTSRRPCSGACHLPDLPRISPKPPVKPTEMLQNCKISTSRLGRAKSRSIIMGLEPTTFRLGGGRATIAPNNHLLSDKWLNNVYTQVFSSGSNHKKNETLAVVRVLNSHVDEQYFDACFCNTVREARKIISTVIYGVDIVHHQSLFGTA